MDTSELIKQVKLRPAIWGTSSKGQDKKAWRQICNMVWPDFDTRPLDEKRTKCLEMQKKWKSLQQSFANDYLRQKQGRGRGVHKTQHYDQLSFLVPVIENKRGVAFTGKDGKHPTSSTPITAEAFQYDIPTPSPSSASVSSSVLQERDRDSEEDRQFLLSLVSFMQDVPRPKKLELRAEILQLLVKYSNNEEICAPISQEY